MKHLFLLLLQLCVVKALFCGNCNILTAKLCCLMNPPSCCPMKGGTCVAPAPEIPPQGIMAVLCMGDDGCSGVQKCCPILQKSSGNTFNICQLPMPLAPGGGGGDTTPAAGGDATTAPP